MTRAILALAGTAVGVVLLLSFKTVPLEGTDAGTALTVDGPARTAARPTGRVSPMATRPPARPVQTKSGRAPAKPRATKAAPPPRKPPAPEPPREVTQAGEVVQTRYGPVQVQVVLAGERIASVTALQLPTGASRTVQISQRSVPEMTRRVLEAQSADVDTVSGATYTSQGYLKSLQSALDAG